jgi:hypothetical protein
LLIAEALPPPFLTNAIRNSPCEFSPHARTMMISLPGWCLLSRKHARAILDIPSHLGGLNLWPAFERVWAPEEIFLPTALAISGNMDGVLRRALTHSRWDRSAADHGDRAHPLSYDGSFGDELVSRTRAEGCLFLRKVKRPLDLSVWEGIVVRRERGRDAGAARSTGLNAARGGRDRGGGSGGGRGRYGDRYDHPPRERDQSHHSMADYDSRRSHDLNGREGDRNRRKRELADHYDRDDYRKRQPWRR